MKRLFAFCTVLPFLLIAGSCSLNESEGRIGGDVISVKCNIAEFVPAAATKLTTSFSGTGVSSVWNEGDAIGVFPDTGGDQVSFSIAGGAGASTAVFNGQGWGLLSYAKYSAYYPFSPDNYGDFDARKNIKLSYSGQSQAEKNTFAVGQFDYLACTNAVPSFSDPADPNGTCTFNFSHLGALIILDVKFPAPAYISTLELSCTDNLFVENGTVDLSQPTPVITPTAKGNTLSLDLGGMSVFANETVRFYLMAAPANLINESLTLKATTTSGTEMVQQMSSSFNLKAGRSYSASVSLPAPQQVTAILKASPAAFSNDYKASDITFRITSNQSYTLAPNVSWITKVSESLISETEEKTIKEYTYRLTINNDKASRSGDIVITGETRNATVSVLQTGLTLSAPVASAGHTIYTTTGDFKYRYGPSIIINDNGTIDAWFASPGHNGKADEFTWRRTSNGGQSWTAEQTVLTGGTKGQDLDWWSVCDPGAACFDGYYYMAYTSTTNTSSDGGLQGLENDCFIARSTSPSGPWQKWNGSGWGGHPRPIIEYMDGSEHNGGPAGKWGIGEPSIVVKDETIYLYYTYDAGGTPVTKVATAPRSNPNWPGSLTFHGTAVDKAWLANEHDHVADPNLIGTYDSCDVKYVEDYGLFYAFHTSWRITQNSRLSVWTSVDGLTFKYLGDVTGDVVKYAHNMGVSGDGLGHVNLSRTQYVSYAYSPEVLPSGVTSRAKGGWSTYWSELSY